MQLCVLTIGANCECLKWSYTLFQGHFGGKSRCALCLSVLVVPLILIQSVVHLRREPSAGLLDYDTYAQASSGDQEVTAMISIAQPHMLDRQVRGSATAVAQSPRHSKGSNRSYWGDTDAHIF